MRIGTVKKLIIFAAVFVFCILCGGAIYAENNVLWSVESAEPGNVGMVMGEGLENIDYVEIYRLPDADITGIAPEYVRTAKPNEYIENDGNKHRTSISWKDGEAVKAEIVQKSDTCVQFVVPQDMSYGIYAVGLGGVSDDKIQLCNQPVTDWMQGDMGVSSSSGGWIRVCGRNISAKEAKPTLAFENKSSGEITFVSSSNVVDGYTVEYEIPSYLACGDYYVYAHNGYGGSRGWSTPYEYKITDKLNWKIDEFNVKDFGAAGDGSTNDTVAFYKALEAAEKNNGGVVYIPRGRYYLTAPLRIPRYTTLRGAGENLVQLFWTDEQWDIGALPEAYLFGTDNFAIEDVSLVGKRVLTVIKSDWNTPTAGNVFLKNLYVRFNPMNDGAVRADWLQTLLSEVDRVETWAIDIGGENVSVTGCSVSSIHGPIRLHGATGGTVKNNEFFVGYSGWSAFVGVKKCIIEDNTFRSESMNSSSMGVNTLYDTYASENLYYARNKVYKVASNDRELFTTDGGRSAYYGALSHLEGTNAVFPEGTVFQENELRDFLVIVVKGKGLGQYRTITANTPTAITLSSPFSIQPDKTSAFTVVRRIENIYLVDNEFFEGGNLQFYGVSMRGVMDGNIMTKCGGIASLAGEVYSAIQPNFYNIIYNNKVYDGNHFHNDGLSYLNPDMKGNNAVREPGDFLSGNAAIMLRTSSQAGLAFMGCTLRNNYLSECALFKLTDGNLNEVETRDTFSGIVYDNNYVGNTDLGFSIDAAVKDVVIYHTTFDNVDAKYSFKRMATDGRGIKIVE